MIDRITILGGSSVYIPEFILSVISHNLTVREIVEKSSNVGIIKVGRTLPRETLRDYIVRFGFGRKTGIDLPGECPGMVTPLSRMSSMISAYSLARSAA